MTGLVRRHRDDRAVRDVALRVTSGCPPVNDRCRMARLLGYVKASMRYERDPRGGELIHDGADTLERLGAYGEAAGDCDDAAVCLSTMLESLGIRTAFVAVSTRPDRRLHHVMVEARDGPAGSWYALDPFRRETGNRPLTRTMRVPV